MKPNKTKIGAVTFVGRKETTKSLDNGRNIARSQKDAQSTSHRLSMCQVVHNKRLFKVLSESEFSGFNFFLVLSPFDFLHFVTI